MASIIICGFELQSVSSGMECTAAAGSPTIDTTTFRSGLASMRCNGMVSGTAKGLRFNFAAAAGNGPYYAKVYFRLTTVPSAANTILQWNDTNAFTTQIASIELNNDRTLQMRDEDGTIGSTSAAIALDDFENYIEMAIDLTGGAGAHVLSAYLNGTQFATSSTRSLSAGVLTLNLGANLNAEAQTAGDWRFDDLVINDSTGSYENGLVGAGELIMLRPTGDSSVAWTRGGSDSGANWSQLEETTPNDVTDYVTSNTAEQIDLYTLADTPAALASDDVIKGVFPGVRFAVDTATGADPDITIGLSSGGNVDESANIDVSSTNYRTNDPGGVLVNYPALGNNSNYEVPNTATAWTKSDIDGMLYRLRESVTDTHSARVSAVWVYVHHKPAPVGGRTTKNTDPQPLGVFAGISRRVANTP